MAKTSTKSKLYKGVYKNNYHGKRNWMAKVSINGKIFWSMCETEREAAIKYDKIMIENGKSPVNILKIV